MWYWGAGPHGNFIGHAVSLNGSDWTRIDGPAIDRSVYDTTMDGSSALALTTPCVVKVGGTYHMWYSRAYLISGKMAFTIGYATSPDGLQWTHVPGSGSKGAVLDMGPTGNFDEATVVYESVIYRDNEFHLWYTGANSTGSQGIGYATSPDGITWTRVSGNAPNGASKDDGVCPSVLQSGNGYKMWFSSNQYKGLNYATSGLTDGVRQENVPTSSLLRQNYPNPFNPTTNFEYTLSHRAQVKLQIFNELGVLITTLVDGMNEVGVYTLPWNGKTSSGATVSSGTYFIRLSTDGLVQTKRITLVK